MVGAIGAGGMTAMWQRIAYPAGQTAAREAASVSALSPAAPEQNGVSPVGAAGAAAGAAALTPFGPAEMPYIPEGFGPEELASRTKAAFPDFGTPLLNALEGKLTGLENREELENIPGVKVDEAKSPADVMNEEKCETCARRKYQDGSDDPGVSFKTAQHVDPSTAGAAVRGHEQEHVVRERAKAEREDRKVISQSVTYRTGICPECGRFYVAGGTTRTVTAADNTKDDRKSLAEDDDDGFDISA